MRNPPEGYLALSLLFGMLGCVVAWTFTGCFPVLVVGLAAGVGSLLTAMRLEE